MIFNPVRYRSVEKFTKEIFPIPTQVGTLTYNGSVQSPVWNNYNSSYMTVTGQTSGTDAGTYTVTFSLNDPEKYVWANYTTDDKVVKWNIQKAMVYKPYQVGTLSCTGYTLTPTWANYDPSKMDIVPIIGSGEPSVTSAIDAGTYLVSFSTNNNYYFYNELMPGDTGLVGTTVQWEIVRGTQNISVYPSVLYLTKNNPTATITVSGAKGTITPIFGGGGYLTGSVSGNVITVTGHIDTPDSYASVDIYVDGGNNFYLAYESVKVYISGFGNGSTTDKNPNTITLNPESVTLNGNGSTKTVQVSRLGNGAITAYSASPSIADVTVSGTTLTITQNSQYAGFMTTIYVNVAETDEYQSASETLTVYTGAGSGTTKPTPSLPDGISVNPTSISLNNVGDSATVQVTTVESMGFSVNIPYEHRNHISANWDANEGGHGGTILFTQLENVPTTFSVPIVFTSGDTVNITVSLSGGSTEPTPTPSSFSINPTSISLSGVNDSKIVQVLNPGLYGFDINVPYEHTSHFSAQSQSYQDNYNILCTQLANVNATFDVPIVSSPDGATINLSVTLHAT